MNIFIPNVGLLTDEQTDDRRPILIVDGRKTAPSENLPDGRPAADAIRKALRSLTLSQDETTKIEAWLSRSVQGE